VAAEICQICRGFFRRLAFFRAGWYSIDNRRDATDRRLVL
jgi:hypothetical protein